MAAREVAVAAIATVYSLDAADDEGVQTLSDRIAGRWSLATALAFLAWFVFAPQCISTIAVTRRETNGWKWPHVHGHLPVRAGLSRGWRDLLDGGRFRPRLTLPDALVRPNARSNEQGEFRWRA